MMFVQILNKATEDPLAGASVNISSSAVSTSRQFSSHHSTLDGMVEESGVFTVSLAYEGYISKHEDITKKMRSIHKF